VGCGADVGREEGRGKREEGRGKREEGRGKREEGRADNRKSTLINLWTGIF